MRTYQRCRSSAASRCRVRSVRKHARAGVLASVAFAAVALVTWPASQPREDTHKGAHNLGLAPLTRQLFFRAVYGGYGGTRLPPARAGARYGVMILNHSDSRVIPRLRAGNRGLKVLMYVDMMGSDRRDPR